MYALYAIGGIAIGMVLARRIESTNPRIPNLKERKGRYLRAPMGTLPPSMYPVYTLPYGSQVNRPEENNGPP